MRGSLQNEPYSQSKGSDGHESNSVHCPRVNSRLFDGLSIPKAELKSTQEYEQPEPVPPRELRSQDSKPSNRLMQRQWENENRSKNNQNDNRRQNAISPDQDG